MSEQKGIDGRAVQVSINQTFAEKILAAPRGAMVFRKPDIVLTHDNTVSIRKTFEKMGGAQVFDPARLFIALDHNAPPTSAALANDYQEIREFVKDQGITNFYDVGEGICHQLMANHVRPGMIIVGSDSHTCTAGAFNCFAVGIDRTETAGIYKRGETWFQVPQSMRITLRGQLRPGVSAKDLSLWILGKIGAEGANFLSVEYHGEGLATLSVADRMTLANMAAEMGAEGAAFPADEILADFLGLDIKTGVWADPGACYDKELEVDLGEVFPLVAAPHSVDNIKAVAEVEGVRIDGALIGTCTNGRLEDLRVAAEVLDGKMVSSNVRLLVIPASRAIYLQALEEGLLTKMIKAGAIILASSCGPCLGTGQGIPADGDRVISTANRNFMGRMGNPKASIYLASPATVAASAVAGYITPSKAASSGDVFRTSITTGARVTIPQSEKRKTSGVWNYADVDNLNTDQMFAGNLIYKIMSANAPAILPHLFKGFDESFAEQVEPGDILIAGDNFGCGSAREHPAVGLVQAGVKAVIVKSVNRIFHRASINQGLPLLIHREAVDAYRAGDCVEVDFKKGKLLIGEKVFFFPAMPELLMAIIEKKGLVNWIKYS